MARINLQKLSLFVTPTEKRRVLALFATTIVFSLGSALISAYARSRATDTPIDSNQWPMVDHGKTLYITGFQNAILLVTVPVWIFSFLLLFGFILFVLFPRIDKRLKAANKTVKDFCS
jgi:hypothetical protein